ncbi:MAG: 2'-5' RNA ligase family protein [Cypionkella sp.]|uniref:2'-5' RNA ligase family protein n=1 Tax=Cypionkella sp. TaxID=2811411 RepID=UPI002ABA7978|nr:2'-5' RNA ligase family protein [Cypionkella sp.]MDZ4310852.1 2'-5' RNA ligase family protein [Cypionkella sp.]
MADHQTSTKSDPVGRAVHVLFFASVPPDEIKNQIAEVWRSAGTGERFRHDTLHMSIQAVAGIDELDPTVVERARLVPPALRTAPFELYFDRLMTFNGKPRNRALVLGTDGRNNQANNMAIELHHALRAVGLAPPSRQKVVPHLTLAYGLGFSETRYLAEPIRWTVRDITLIDSLQGQSRHMALGNWPLKEGRQHPSFDF